MSALARVIGPLAASLLYWKYSHASPYFVGALFLLLPLVMVTLLPDPQHDDHSEESLAAPNLTPATTK